MTYLSNQYYDYFKNLIDEENDDFEENEFENSEEIKKDSKQNENSEEIKKDSKQNENSKQENINSGNIKDSKDSENLKSEIEATTNKQNENSKDLKSEIEATTNKLNTFKSKCFYAQYDEREFNFIQSLNDNPYSIITFTKDPIQIDMSHQPPKINLTNKGHVINTTEYFTNNKYIPMSKNGYRDLNSLENVDVKAEYNHLLNSHHNRLLYTNSKSNILIDNLGFIKSIKYLLSQPSMSHINEYSNFVKQFLETSANLRRHMDSIKYITKSTKTNLLSVDDLEHFSDYFTQKKKRIDKYHIFKLSRDIITLINNVSYYFNDIKNSLKFNEKTGYYELTVKDELEHKEQIIPIMCKHTYMTLNGESLYNISNECSFKGVCRYCGDVLDSVSFEDTTTLPRNIAEFVYMLMELYGCSPDNQTIFIYIYNSIAALIAQMIEKDDSNFDNKASSIAALFCYNIITKHPPVIKPTNFLLLLSETLALVGFNEQKIKNTIDSGVLGDTNNVYQSLIDTHDYSLYDFNKIFNDYASKEVKDLKAKGIEQIQLFNTLYKQLRIDNLKLQEIIKSFKEKEKEIEKGDIEPTRFNTLIVFEGYIKKSCPGNNHLNHVFSGSKCKKCGINSDFKNFEEVYEKYETEFNLSYDLKVENKFDMPKYEKIDISTIIKKDSKEAKDKLIRKFNISENEFNVLKQHVIEDLATIIPTLQTWTHSEYNDWTVDEILNMIVYLNNDELYGLLRWYSSNISQYIVVNAETIDSNEIEEDDDE